jgi:hypothetical protein
MAEEIRHANQGDPQPHSLMNVQAHTIVNYECQESGGGEIQQEPLDEYWHSLFPYSQ